MVAHGGDPLAAAGVREGDILVGKYRVERVLGSGGMGVVVAAHHIELDEKVALKFLLPEALKNPQAVSRFVREARAAAKIKSEHVARVSDVGQLDNGSPYMVIEYLDGGDLSTWLLLRGAMSVEMAVDFVLQACEAVAEAHTLGIVHRDLKPANLFCVLRPDGQLSVKVLDFGISKVLQPGADGGALTHTDAVVGSPYYMSPEQLESSKGVDVRTDIWSLGVILFELLTARRPFDAEAVTELAIKIATQTAPAARTLRPDIPAGLEKAISTCLENDRNRRFSSVGELAVTLESFGSTRAHASVERILGTLRTTGGSAAIQPASRDFRLAIAGTESAVAARPPTITAWGNSAAGARARGRPALWAGALLTLGGVGAAFFFLARPSAHLAPPTASTPSAWPAPSMTGSSVASNATAAVSPAANVDRLSVAVPNATPSSEPLAPVEPAGVALRVRSLASSRASPSKPAPAQCDPPYTLDDQGRKHFKAECYK